MAWWIPLTASVIGGIMTNRAGKRNIRMAREDAAKAFKEQQKQAQFQVQQGNQQRSDLLQRLKQSAQGSGIASLAQSLANQGVLQTQRISANIGVQESQNQMAAAKGQLRVQQGEEMLQNKNADMQSTLLGIQYGQATGANQNYQQMQQNVYGARSSAAAANAAAVQGVVDAASGTTFPKIKQPGTP